MNNYLKFLKIFNLKVNKLIILIFLSFAGIVFEIIGISIFIPIFQYIKNEGNINILINESVVWENLFNFYNLINMKISLATLLITALILFSLRQIFNYVKLTYRATVHFNVTKNIRFSLLQKFFNSNFQFQKKYSIGNLINLFTVEVNSTVLGLLTPVETISYLIMGFGYIIILSLISLEFTIISVLILLCSLILPYKYIIESKKVGYEITKFNTKVGHFLSTRFNSSQLIKLSSNNKFENKKFDQLTDIQKKNSILSIILFNKTDLIIEPLIIITSLIFIYFSYTYFNFSLEIIGIYLVIILRLMPVFKSLIKNIQAYNNLTGPIDKVFNTINEFEDNMETNEGKIRIKNFTDKIIFSNVDFSYSKQTTLKNVSFAIKSGKRNAIIGPSGSGKSTILNLISKLIVKNNGEIFIDGSDFKNIENNSLRELISYCPQETIIFSDKISEFISYGRNEIEIDKIKEIIKMTSCDTFINLDDLNFLNLNPENFSVGQRKRLDICRAIYQDKPILILDEPNANLDENSQKIITDILNQLNKHQKKTIITIEHKLINIKDYDHIIIVKNGSIEIEGSYEEIIKKNNWLSQTINNTTQNNDK